ncbi:MAG: NAD(P)/FAD-dependent oxidoreductase [Paracoccaceae bacterium]
MPDIIAIGGGQASFSFVSKLRSLGYKKSISLICAENDLPYQRPPLSKKFLVGDLEKERLFLRQQSFYDQNNIEVIKGKKAKEIDRKKSQILLDNGQSLKYTKLFLGLGSEPRLLSKELTNGIPNIFYLRNIGDINLISHQFLNKKKLLILGGGFIGLEVASVARKLGIDVTIIESQERILKRTSSEIVANYLKNIHISNGVIIKEKTFVKKFLYDEKEFFGVLTNNNEEIYADLLIAGIGVEPNTKIAVNAGLSIDNGIVVNVNCRTNDPTIYAAGDCASFPYKGNLIRLESVGNAIEQSEIAAENVMGNKLKYQPTPWFWSDQFDTKLQIAGLNTGFTSVFHRMENDKNSFWYYKKDRLVSVDAFNDSKSYMIGKKFLEMKINPSPSDIISTKINLKKLLRKVK